MTSFSQTAMLRATQRVLEGACGAQLTPQPVAQPQPQPAIQPQPTQRPAVAAPVQPGQPSIAPSAALSQQQRYACSCGGASAQSSARSPAAFSVESSEIIDGAVAQPITGMNEPMVKVVMLVPASTLRQWGSMMATSAPA